VRRKVKKEVVGPEDEEKKFAEEEVETLEVEE
jgi:hypothetical protein